jgi:hypothetical protein
MKDFQVTTICGSMRYFGKMLEWADKLTENGYIVLMPFVTVIKPEDQATSPVKAMLDKMHFVKIEMSDCIHVIGSYIGESTSREIAHAESLDLPVNRIMNP